MSSPSNTPVSSTVASIDSASPSSQAEEPWLPEPEELPNTPWYEEKSSNLKLSDIAIIKEKGGTMGKFEVVLPHPDERAHRPPPGFHTFYMNQIEMALRFPIPRFIAALCHYIKVSPSQLAPNSYSFLLALAVLLSYHKLPLIPYIFMQLIQIKRLGSEKFYISYKGDRTFIKGNPSSDKGWMSRFFYIKCDSMRTRGDERMGKAELLQAMQEAAHASGEVAPPKKEVSKKNRAQTPPTPTSEEAADVPPVLTTAEASSLGKGPERGPPFDPSRDSLVESPSAVAATRYICNMDPDQDLKVLRKADGAEVIGHFAANLASVCRGLGGEMVKRLTQAHRKVNASSQKFDAAMGQHAEVLARLEELEVHRAREDAEVRIQREALEAELASETEARTAEKAAREALEAELGEVKARAVQEAERLRSEAKDEFLKSPEFNVLLGQRAWGFFKNGFWGCLAQFRANGYPEEQCDVLSMQMDSDLVIYRTTLVRTFQVVTICRVDKSEVLVVLISPHYSKRKWVFLVTLAMSLFDLQDLCIAIGSLATLDLPMVVDLIGIYVLKGPYCTLTTTNWFLQALSVIPRGSWRDVARRFTMIRWASGLKNCFRIIILSFGNCVDRSDRIGDRDYDEATPPSSRPTLSSTPRRRRPPLAPSAVAAVARFSRGRTCFDHVDEEIPFVPKFVSSSSAD
ncbi:hypothetical protein F511_36078 [Dorcoceras hygrometricum]|uniref:Uncharacterized protein n=1 Tax=Dorcoceras hygrometricum TaxID=472368 RepID=A0A2Z7D707_9LAMI|nr:hypothetical protein F511_36078 [Dorcoceras hygrometricum]